MPEPSWRTLLSVLVFPFLLIEVMVKAMLFPPKPPTKSDKPTGYKWRDPDGQWHTRYYVYDNPPT
jgi:hypothetical protein